MKKSLWTMAAALALVGCSQDQLMPDNPVVQNKGAVGANIFVPATSRGTALNSVSDFEQSGFGFDLIAYSYDADGNATSFMGEEDNGIRFTYDDVWDYANRGEMKFWQDVPDGAETMKFFAVSPAYEELPDDGTTGYTIGDTEREIDYTVPADVKEHQDLMYAQTDLNDWSSTSNAYLNGVPLNFHHALSQIVFQARIADKDDGFVTAEINSISVNNIYGSGVFDMAAAAEILANESILDGDGTLDDKKDNEGYDYNLWEIWGNGNVSYTVSSDDLFQTEISDITSTALTGGSIEDGTETAMLLIPQELTALDLSTIGDNVNSAKMEQLEAKGISLDNAQGAGDYFEISCKVKFNGTDYIVGSEDEYESIYIPITTGAWNPGYKYIYTLIFSADSGDPVKATVVSVDEWNSYGEDAPNSGDNDDADDEEEEETPAVFDYANGKILIKDAADLKLMGELINEYYNPKRYAVNKAGNGVFTVDVDEDDDGTPYPEYASAAYLQVNDIDLAAYDNWTPIAQYATFAGSYDGNGKIIENLKISANSSIKAALFGGTTGNATLENITIVSGSITNEGGYAAAIAGSTNGATITNCVVGVAGNKEAVKISGKGAAGIVYEAVNTTFKGCINYVNVEGLEDWRGYHSAGIACGNMNIYSGENSIFIDCINYGDISSKDNVPPKVAGISSDGGIMFINCHNYGNITSTGSEAAGIVTQTMTETVIIACHNGGDITAKNDGGAGICYDPYASITLRGCYNTGKCSAGLVSFAYSSKGTFTMEACYDTGDSKCLVGADTQFKTEEASLIFTECYYTKCQDVFSSYYGWDGLVTDGATEFNDELHVWFGEGSGKTVVMNAMNAILDQENDIPYQPNGDDYTKDATHPLSHPSSKE